MANIGYRPVTGSASSRILKIFTFLYLFYKPLVPASALEGLSPSGRNVQQVFNPFSRLFVDSQHAAKRRLHPTVIQSKQLLPQPTNLTVRSVNSTQVQLSWSYNSLKLLSPQLKHNLSFILQVQESSKGSFSVIQSLQGHVHTFVYSLLRYKQYRFRVVATSLGLNNASDVTEWVFGGLGLASPPSALRVGSVSAATVSLVWKASSPAVCSVYWSTDVRKLMTQHQPQLIDCVKERFTVKNMKPNLTYYFCVSGYTVVESVCSNVVKATPISSSTSSATVLKKKMIRIKRAQGNVFAKAFSMHMKFGILGTVLPQVTNLTVRSVNASHVQLSWRYNYTLLSPKTLYNNLSFEVQVARGGNGFISFAMVPASEFKCVFPMGSSFEQYSFRIVTTSSGQRNASVPTATIYSGLYPPGPPANFRVLTRDSFSVSLGWDKGITQSYLVVIYWGSTPETLMVQNEPLYVDDTHSSYTVQNLNPGQLYYFCVTLYGLIETVCSNLINTSTSVANLSSVSRVAVSSEGLRSLTVKWQEPVMPKGLAIYHYLVYSSLGDKFDRRASNVTICTKSPCILSEGLEELADYAVVVSYLAVKQGSSPEHWSEEGSLSTPVIFSLPPDAQSVLLVCQSCEPISSTEVKLLWMVKGVESVSDLDEYGFHILIRDSSRDTLLLNATVAKVPYITLSGLQPGVTHWFTLQLQDNLGYKGNVTACHPCLTREIAPTSSPASVTATSEGKSQVNISWAPVPPESRGGLIEYEVHVKANLCTAYDQSTLPANACQWCTEGKEIVQSTSSQSLAMDLGYRQAYQVRVRGVTGGGTLYGPYSQSFCFQTPEKVPEESPTVEYSPILDQAVCVKWIPLSNANHYIEGYQIEVDALNSSVESLNRTAYNVTSGANYYVVPANMSTALYKYSLTVRGYSSAGFGPRSPSAKVPLEEEQSLSRINISASLSLADPCGNLTLHWKVPPNNTCGWYSTLIAFYPTSMPTRLQTLVENSPVNRMDVNRSSLDMSLEYTFEMSVKFVSYDGVAMYKSVAVAKMVAPSCPAGVQVNAIVIGLTVSIIVILCAVVVVALALVVYWNRNKYRSRSLRDLPRSRHRIQQRLNPYIDYPRHPYRSHSPSEMDRMIDFDSQSSQSSLLDSHTATATDLPRISGLSAQQSSTISDSESRHAIGHSQSSQGFTNDGTIIQNPSLSSTDSISQISIPLSTAYALPL